MVRPGRDDLMCQCSSGASCIILQIDTNSHLTTEINTYAKYSISTVAIYHVNTPPSASAQLLDLSL